MKSRVIELYTEWLTQATSEEIAFVDAVYTECEANYEAGGDTVVECYTPTDILETFKDMKQVKELCGLHVEKALNCRFGEDTDPELAAWDRFKDWEAKPVPDITQ